MRKFNLNFLLLIILSILCSSYGYSGNLPQFEIPVNNTQQKEPDIPVQRKNPELAPKSFPDMYSGIIIKQGQYKEYLKDLDEIIPVLQNLKQNIENNEDRQVQIFGAKANAINLYVNNLERKYGKRPESNYESYKKIIELNKDIIQVTTYWKSIGKYKSAFRGSLSDKLSDQAIINQKLDKLQQSINYVLEVLRNDAGNF